MNKPFLSVADQVTLLETRGLKTDANTAQILLCENYYSVVNGYKTYFLDHEKTANSSSDVYLEGAKFSEVYNLFLFDRSLRETIFHYLVKVEARIKAIAVYTFCEEFPDADAYLNRNSYTDENDYMLGSYRHNTDMDELISTLKNKAYDSRHCKDFIRHYRDNHSTCPLWVLANDITFGNVSFFYNAQKRHIQNRICKRIVECNPDDKSQKGYLSPYKMRKALSIMVDYRNICAHDERMYCAKVGPKNQYSFKSLYGAIELVLGTNEVEKLADQIIDLAFDYGKDGKIIHSILTDLDFVLVEEEEKGTPPAE